jgi:solute carrier family 35 protein F5
MWVSSSVLQQKVFLTYHYPKPYFLSYFVNLLFSFYLSSFCVKLPSKEFSRILIDALQLGPVWFGANLFQAWSLVLTGVGSNTILSSLTGVFALVLSIGFLKQSADLLKFVAAITSIGGVMLIAAEDNDLPEANAYMGDMLALTGAFLYAVYSIMLKQKQYSEDILHLFGVIGVVNSVLFLPGLLLLNYIDVEPFAFPQTLVFGYFLLAAMTSSVILDVLLAISINFLSPVLCQLSLTLTIPLSLLYEFFLEDKRFSGVYILGSFLVLGGFTLMTLFENDKWAQKLSNRSVWRCLTNSADSKKLVVDTKS